MQILRTIGLATVLACAAAAAGAQPAGDFPNRPVRLVVPFPPAGPTDVVARLIGQKLSERFGQPVVVENRAGAGGSIGASAVASAAPDGYTLVMGSTANMAINVTLMAGRLSYHPLRDFSPVNLAAMSPNVLAARPDLPADDISGLVELARARPGTITYASGGVGTPSHLAAEQFKVMTGVDMLHVPYKGSIPALADVMSGQVDLMFDSMSSALPLAQGGKLKALAQTGAHRAAAAPDLPTVQESGLPGYAVTGWFGVLAPAGTPGAVVDKLSEAISAVLALPDVRQRYAALGLEPGPAEPAAFAAFIESEIAQWATAIKAAGIQQE